MLLGMVDVTVSRVRPDSSESRSAAVSRFADPCRMKRMRLNAFIVAVVMLSTVLVGVSFVFSKEAAVDWSIVNDSGSDLDIAIYVDGDRVSSMDALENQFEMHNTSSYTIHFNMFSDSNTILFTVIGTDQDGNQHIAEETFRLRDGDKAFAVLTLY